MNKNKLFIFPLAAIATLSLSSCSFKVTKNPNLDFTNKALEYYKNLRKKLNITDDKQEYHAWYYNSELLKGVVFNSLTDYEYLGIINFQNLCFSDTESKYYLDIPNYDISYDNTTGNFDLPSFVDNPIDFMKQLPMVLIKDSDASATLDDVYTKFDEEGNIDQYAYKENYDPTLFYLDDFKFELNIEKFKDFDIDYSTKKTAILKRDVYSLIESMTGGEGNQLPLNLSLSKILLKSYNRANNLSDGQKIPTNLTIPGYFGKDKKNVALGPIGFKELFEEETYKDITSVKLEEGVTDLCFFAFNDATNLKEINIPSTLETISLSSLSNLNLDTLYVSDTKKQLNLIETKGATFTFDFTKPGTDTKINLTVSSQFHNTKINNLIFENYDNKNAIDFPYNDLTLPENKKIADIVSYVDKDGNKTYKSLTEGFKNTNAINPIYNLNIPENKIISDEKFTKLNKGQSLFLASAKSKKDGTLINADLNKYRDYNAGNNTISDAIYTLKLENDLEIEGTLVSSGTIGRNDSIDGIAISNYTNIDLNGHKLTVLNGGLLDINGKVIDSSATKSGEIIVNKGGIIKTNLITHDVSSHNSYISSLNNGINPFNEYDFADLNCNIKLFNGSKMYAKETLTDEFSSINYEFLYFGNPSEKENYFIKPLNNNENGYLSIIKNNDKTILNFVDNEVEFNKFIYSNKQSSENFYFPIVSNILDINVLNSKLTLNNNYKLTNGGKLYIDSKSTLNLNGNIFVYSKLDNSLKDLNANYQKESELIIDGNLILKNGNFINGLIKTNEESTFNKLLVIFNKVEYKYNEAIKDGYYNKNTNSFNSIDNLKFDFIVKDLKNNKKYSRYNKGYFYLDNGNDRTINNVSNPTTVLAYKNSGSTWIIDYNGTLIDSNSNNEFISTVHHSDSSEDATYTLTNEGAWAKASDINPTTHTYLIEGKTFIKYKNELLEGVILDKNILSYKLFETTQGKLFIFDDSSDWKYIELFEKDNVVAYFKNDSLVGNKIYNSENYSKVRLVYNSNFISLNDNKDYDSINHIIKNNTDKYIVSDLNKSSLVDNIDLTHKIASDSTNKFVYSNEDGWIYAKNSLVTVEESSYLISSNKNAYYGYISSNWEKVEKFNSESTHGFTLFKILNLKDNSKNFAILMDNGSQKEITQFVKCGGIDIKKDNLVDSLKNLIPADAGNEFVGHQYILINGEKYVFALNDTTGVIELFKFETGVFNTISNSEIVDLKTAIKVSTIKLTYIEDGVEKTKVLYIDFDNLIYCGNTSDKTLTSLDYFGVATYSNKLSETLNPSKFA